MCLLEFMLVKIKSYIVSYKCVFGVREWLVFNTLVDGVCMWSTGVQELKSGICSLVLIYYTCP